MDLVRPLETSQFRMQIRKVFQIVFLFVNILKWHDILGDQSEITPLAPSILNFFIRIAMTLDDIFLSDLIP